MKSRLAVRDILVLCLANICGAYAQGSSLPAVGSAAPTLEAAPSGLQKMGAIDTSGQGLANLRDPFRQPMTFDPASRTRTELETFPIEQYRMVGVLTGPLKLRAMLVAPNGKTYFVAENMKIGVRNGVIRKITSNGMTVRERVLNTLGQEETVDLQLKLAGS